MYRLHHVVVTYALHYGYLDMPGVHYVTVIRSTRNINLFFFVVHVYSVGELFRKGVLYILCVRSPH